MYRLGMDIGGTKTAIAAVDETGLVYRQDRLLSKDALESHSKPAPSLADSIRAFCRKFDISLNSVRGIGIGFPGVMDRLTQTIANCPNLEILNGERFGPDLEGELGLPVVVENDVNVIALGEYYHGRGKGIPDLAAVYVGSGLGCGLILDGKLYVGADGAAGELGHIPIEPNGITCTCGRVGCLEMYCSGKALAVRSRKILQDVHNFAEPMTMSWSDAKLVIDAARQGHEPARQAMQQMFYYLGIALTNLVNILNPRLVILGGGIVTAWPEGIDIAREIIQQRARTVIRNRLVIDQGILGESAALIGASMLIR